MGTAVGSFRANLMASVSRVAPLLLCGAIGVLGVAAPKPAAAFNLYDGENYGNNLEINLNITAEYSVFERVNNPSKILISPTGNANGSEGDLAFQHGIVSNLFEVLPVFDVKDGNFGFHASGEAYLNTKYLSPNQNDQPGTFNPYTVGKNTDFTSGTRNVEGQNARLLDAFVFGQHNFADGDTFQLKVGRQTLLWGQSLFLTGDSIAGGQAPLDIITAQNTPNAQAQQIFLPVGQVVVTYQPQSNYALTFQGYYQFEWEHDNFQGVGGYFNSADILDKGGERVILGSGIYAYRTKDLTPPSQNGQFGASVQGRLGELDLGLYALRFDSKAPSIYLQPGNDFGQISPNQVGTYRIVYPRDIAIYGASVSTNVGPANVAGEISGRTNQPLLSGGGIVVASAANPGNANSDPLYAVGDTVQAQVSSIYVSPPLPFDPGGLTFEGEIELNHVVSVTKNEDQLTPGRQGTAGTTQFVIEPSYLNVLPNLNVSFPVGIGYNYLGRSEIDVTQNHGTGSFNIGVTGVYRSTWTGTITYNDYLGKPTATYAGGGQVLADRGYVSLTVQHTF